MAYFGYQHGSKVGVFFGFVAFILVVVGYATSAWLNTSGSNSVCNQSGFVSAFLWQTCCHDCTATVLGISINVCQDSYGGNNQCQTMKDPNNPSDAYQPSSYIKTARAMGLVTVVAVFVGLSFQIAYHFREAFKLPSAGLKLLVIISGLVAAGAFAGDSEVQNLIAGQNGNDKWAYSYSFGLFVAGWCLELLSLLFMFLC